VMARGGCQITTTTSRIDARLETRLAAILSELMGDERHASLPRGGSSS
jgi:flagellar assembly protein FliH